MNFICKGTLLHGTRAHHNFWPSFHRSFPTKNMVRTAQITETMRKPTLTLKASRYMQWWPVVTRLSAEQESQILLRPTSQLQPPPLFRESTYPQRQLLSLLFVGKDYLNDDDDVGIDTSMIILTKQRWNRWKWRDFWQQRRWKRSIRIAEQ